MVRKAKEIITYIILAALSAISVFLIVFAFRQRLVCIEDGNLEAAEHCLVLGIVCIVLVFVFLAAMTWTWKRSRRAEDADRKAGLKWDSPLFEKWYLKETEDIEKNFGRWKILAMIFSIFMVISMLQSLFLLLDGGSILPVISLLFSALVIFLMNRMADYEKKFISPLDGSIRRNLPDASLQENFAKQISKARKMAYMPAAGSGTAYIWLGPDYCYIRQPKKCGIIKNQYIDRAVLKRISYAVGARHVHWRTCYVMEFFHGHGEKKPFWNMYFRTKEELYKAVSGFQNAGLSESQIHDKT